MLARFWGWLRLRLLGIFEEDTVVTIPEKEYMTGEPDPGRAEIISAIRDVLRRWGIRLSDQRVAQLADYLVDLVINQLERSVDANKEGASGHQDHMPIPEPPAQKQPKD